MARSRATEQKSAQLSAQQMAAAIPKLDRRIADLEKFDVSTIQERFDPLAEALARKVNGTLQEILGHDTVEYHEYSVWSFDTLPLRVGGGHESLAQVHDGYREGVKRGLLKLRTLRELFQERVADATTETAAVAPHSARRTDTRRVFVVHGHDTGAKESVARFLERLELEPIILHERPNLGRTVIEKFEAHSDVAFAVVLLTPDDVGYPAGAPDQAKPRARQNVILELGFFAASLGRDKVCALYSSGVEIPSDFSGVLYHELDPGGAWRLLLARELSAAGLTIDMNQAL